MSLAEKIKSHRENSLNGIRLALATMVIFSHCFALTLGKDEDFLTVWGHNQLALGGLAVNLFFFISGFLITASWLKSKSMNDYIRRRILRIFPAYVIALVFSVLVGSCFALHPFQDFHFRVFLLLHDVFTLGMASLNADWIFPYNPHPFCANLSLWTIPREFLCYLLVALIGMFGLFKNRGTILLGFLLVWFSYSWIALKGLDTFALDRRFLTFFMAGCCTWLYRDKIPLNAWLALAALTLCMLGICLPPLLLIVTPVAAGYFVLWLAYYPKLRSVASWCDKTDLSYGVYLFAFPIQQAIVALKDHISPWGVFIITMPLVLGLAYVSWMLIERPCLRLKSRKFADYDPAMLARAPASLEAKVG